LKPIPRAEMDSRKIDGVISTLEHFRREERLAPFFEAAEVVAVYPINGRAANGVGFAYGRGLVFEKGDRVIGHTRMWQLSMGPQVGGQLYRQILFFKSRAIYEAFMRSPAEFAGQFNAAALIVGVSSTPSFNGEVALFTQLLGGLLLEASIGAHRYTFAPIED
ncbi:MAG: hypothetical protein ACC642_10890, partial [Pseudomonadales bacterium]